MLFRRTQKRELPAGAVDVTLTKTKTGTVAKWTDPGGRRHTTRVEWKNKFWVARYRTADGRTVERSTGCESKDLAQAKLSDWLTMEEKQRSGIITASEATAGEWAHVFMTDHIDAFKATMQARNLHAETVRMRTYYLTRIFKECHITRFTDVKRARLERWLHDQVNGGMGLRTANGYIAALVVFGNWALREGRVSVNPFTGTKKFNEKTDRRRPRRAFTPEELGRLYKAAAERPLHEATYKATRGGKAVKAAKLSPATVDAALWLGRVRSLAYMVMANTGLRFGELRSITLGQVHLDQTPAYLDLHAEHEKARRGAKLPLPSFVAVELGVYIADLKKRLLGHSTEFPGALTARPLFDIPGSMICVFNRDLVYAGLATKTVTGKGKKTRVHFDKKNDRGESVDLHCLRHSFITNLALTGASMVTVAKAARHSDPRLTLKVYSHVGLEELGNAVDRLPIPGGCTVEQVVNDIPGEGIKNLPPYLPPEQGNLIRFKSIKGVLEEQNGEEESDPKTAKTPVNTGVFVVFGSLSPSLFCSPKTLLGESE